MTEILRTDSAESWAASILFTWFNASPAETQSLLQLHCCNTVNKQLRSSSCSSFLFIYPLFQVSLHFIQSFLCVMWGISQLYFSVDAELYSQFDLFHIVVLTVWIHNNQLSEHHLVFLHLHQTPASNSGCYGDEKQHTDMLLKCRLFLKFFHLDAFKSLSEALTSERSQSAEMNETRRCLEG